MGLELALIIQSKPVRIASDNFGSNSASAFQADAYQQKTASAARGPCQANTVPPSPLDGYPTATRAIRVGIGVLKHQTMLTGRLPSWDT